MNKDQLRKEVNQKAKLMVAIEENITVLKERYENPSTSRSERGLLARKLVDQKRKLRELYSEHHELEIQLPDEEN